MFERNDDVLFICYDNEAYMNTGVQRSGATPPAARTATTEAVGPHPGNAFGQGKNMPELAMAHGIPYVATATVADLHDLEDKVTRAMEIHGARYIHVLVTCPTRSGLCSERHGEGRPARYPDGPLPSLRGRARRGGPARRRSGGLLRSRSTCACKAASLISSTLKGIRLDPTSSPPCRQWPTATFPAMASSRAERCRPHDREALRHHPRGRVQPGQQDRLVAGRAAGVRRPPASVQQRLPQAGENIQQWLYLAEDGCYEAAWPKRVPSATTRFPPSWDEPASTRARRPATGPKWTICGDQRLGTIPGRPTH